MEDSEPEDQTITCTAAFVPPSIHTEAIKAGASYTHHSSIPTLLCDDTTTPCVLGIDEAGRGPVLGPMVYGAFYLPLKQHRSLLADTHHFDDSKVLTSAFRATLMQRLCTPTQTPNKSDLYSNCGWAVRVLSARDISADMAHPDRLLNLNAQAQLATEVLIGEIIARKVNIQEIYIDTVGHPDKYQKYFKSIFPAANITVAKKADSLYPCVSAASVCAKVTRDVALEHCYHTYTDPLHPEPTWGSGYPSDGKCTSWLKQNRDNLFGWGDECRFSWGTASELLEDAKTGSVQVIWPEVGKDVHQMRLSDMQSSGKGELESWYGSSATETMI